MIKNFWLSGCEIGVKFKKINQVNHVQSVPINNFTTLSLRGTKQSLAIQSGLAGRTPSSVRLLRSSQWHGAEKWRLIVFVIGLIDLIEN